MAKAITALQLLAAADMNAADVAKFVDLAVKVERAALGEQPTVAVTGPGGGPLAVIDYTNMDPATRRARLADLAVEAARRAGISLTDATDAADGPDDESGADDD